MARVLRIINRLNLGGPTFNASYLTKYLEPDFRTLLVAGMKDDSEASSSFIPESLGIEPRFVRHMHRALHPVRDWRSYRELRAIIREYRPHIVHTHAAKPGAVGRLAALHEKVPVVLHTFHGHVFHSYFGSLKTRFFLAVERHLAARSAGVIAISESQADELVREYLVCDPSKVHLVPLGFDLSRFHGDREEKRQRFRRAHGLHDGEVAIGIVGRLVPVKNHAMFLDAIAQLRGRVEHPVKAFIVGDGELRSGIERFAAERGLPFSTPDKPRPDAPVVFTSWIREVDVAYAGLDIVALTSRNEGTPVSLIEAQASARPIVTTGVGGIRDVVHPEESAFVVDRDDTDGFADALARLVNDPELRRRMGAFAEQDSRERFSYMRLVHDMKELYDRLLQEAGVRQVAEARA